MKTKTGLEMQLFNKEQSEGFAKIADNLATATIVATVVGGFIDNKIDMSKGFILLGIAILFLGISYNFRKGEDDGD
ncbi:MAG: hypothetical protein PHC99_02785 [Methylococcales bacterium]|nr:hypothetical protein [Methylococcales bacterium]